MSSSSGDARLAVQPLLAGGEHVTAWREVTRGGARTLYTSVAWSHPEKTSVARALGVVRRAAEFGALTQDHRRWWHDYYRHSFLSIPDTRLQSFYWIQLYKVASAARREAPVMATSGPWLENTPWPATWWNLNVQLEYWLIHGSNHLELDAVSYALDKYRANLTSQVAQPYQADSAGIPRTTDMTLLNGVSNATSGFPVGIPGQDTPTPEVGNLTWALHNVWLSYRHTMDRRLLRDTLFPLLRKAINYYLHFLAPGPDGKLHLPPTFSPEYGVNAPGLQLRPLADPLGLPDAAADRAGRPAGAEVAGRPGFAGGLPGRRQRVHDRRRACRSRSRTGTTRTCCRSTRSTTSRGSSRSTGRSSRRR